MHFIYYVIYAVGLILSFFIIARALKETYRPEYSDTSEGMALVLMSVFWPIAWVLVFFVISFGALGKWLRTPNPPP